MGEHKNTILAILLSLIVVVGWQYFIGYPQMQHQQEQAQLKKQEETQVQPGAAQPAPAQPSAAEASAPPVPNAPSAEPPAASREAVIKSSPRVAVDTPRLHGTIDLKGGRIDDLSLQQFREDVDPNSPPIVLFSPSGAPDAYYAEFGWVPAAGTSAAMPGPDTVWQQDGSGALGVDHPVTLSYDNGQGLTFTRTIAVDDHYLFTVKDQVANKGGDAVTLFPYALISRHGTPPVLGYYILHEGPIGMMGADGEKEETYKKIADLKSESWDVTDAWLGFTDKYWAAVLLPNTDAKVKTRFSASDVNGKEIYQTDYLAQPQTIAPGATGSADARLFAGAKEVSVVGINFPLGPGGYNQSLHLNHFDLLIDWGWFYFITKPMFLAIDYFFHLVGNFGIAILIVTVLRQASVLPARQQVLRLDGEDEGGAAADGDDQGALRQRQDEAAAGDDGALQEGADQSHCRLSADRDPDSGVLLALQGAVHHHRNAPCAVLRLDPRSLGAGPDQHLYAGRIDPVRSGHPAAGRRLPASRLLAGDHGRDHVGADEAQSGAARSDPADDLQLDAADLHLHAGEIPGRPRHLLGLEQLALGRAAERDHAQARRQNSVVG